MRSDVSRPVTRWLGLSRPSTSGCGRRYSGRLWSERNTQLVYFEPVDVLNGLLQ